MTLRKVQILRLNLAILLSLIPSFKHTHLKNNGIAIDYEIFAKAFLAAAMVASISSWLCAAETKPASKADGAR